MSNKRDSHGNYLPQDPPKQRILDTVLKSIYYDPANVGSFGSAFRLYQAAKSKIRNLRIADVQDWLSYQKTYATHRSSATEFMRRKVLVPGPGAQYQADLIDVSRWADDNNHVRFLLTVIDCFSRRATAIPQTYKSGKRTARALVQAFRDLKGPPKKLQTDRGTEFYNTEVKSVLKKHKIILFSTFQHDTKAQIVERFNRTLRAKINRYKTAYKTSHYLSALPKILSAYNHRKHAAFKYEFAPCEVNMSNRKQVFELQYGEYLKGRNAPFKFQLLDRVLKAKDKKQVIESRKTKDLTFHPTVYEIIDRLHTRPPTYVLKNTDTDEVENGSFYAQQLHLLRAGRAGLTDRNTN